MIMHNMDTLTFSYEQQKIFKNILHSLELSMLTRIRMTFDGRALR